MTGHHQLTPFDLGQIKAHLYHGLRPAAIREIMVKGKGNKRWSHNAIKNACDKFEADPTWKGERAEGSGRPRETTVAEDKAIGKHILDNRGKQKVTVRDIKRTFPRLRQVSNSLVSDRIEEAELAYLPRRKKSKVAKEYLEERVEYCRAVKRKHEKTLALWAYTDGATCYLDPQMLSFKGLRWQLWALMFIVGLTVEMLRTRIASGLQAIARGRGLRYESGGCSLAVDCILKFLMKGRLGTKRTTRN